MPRTKQTITPEQQEYQRESRKDKNRLSARLSRKVAAAYLKKLQDTIKDLYPGNAEELFVTLKEQARHETYAAASAAASPSPKTPQEHPFGILGENTVSMPTADATVDTPSTSRDTNSATSGNSSETDEALLEFLEMLNQASHNFAAPTQSGNNYSSNFSLLPQQDPDGYEWDDIFQSPPTPNLTATTSSITSLAQTMQPAARALFSSSPHPQNSWDKF